MDLPPLLDASDYLPDSSELGQNPVAKENVEVAIQQWQNFTAVSDHEKQMKQSGENIEWWKPLKLNDRLYASKTLGESRDTALVYEPQMDICIGLIRDDLMGVYFVYHTD